MLLIDLLRTELPEWSIKIFATDLDEAAINFARRGLYGESNVHYFVYTIVPSHELSNKVDGVIIYAIDETEKHLREIEHGAH